jgi:cytochrome c
MMLRTALASALILVTVPALAGDPKAGAQVFKKCQACHAVGEGAKNKVGPELNGLFGRAAASIPDYNYSDAMEESGITWTPETFAEYIKNPRAMVPGTAMAFAGLKKDADIENITAYLAQFNADGTMKAE